MLLLLNSVILVLVGTRLQRDKDGDQLGGSFRPSDSKQ